MAIKIDDLDRLILAELESNSRKSFRDIAGKLKVSVGTIVNRVKNLEENGVIKEYTTILDSKKLGYEVAIVEIVVSSGKLLEVEKEISQNPIVHQVYDITGDTDAIIIVKYRNIDELSKFVKSILSMPNVERTFTHVVLTTMKEGSRLLV